MEESRRKVSTALGTPKQRVFLHGMQSTTLDLLPSHVMACPNRTYHLIANAIRSYAIGLVVTGALFVVMDKDIRTRGRNGFGNLSVSE